MKIHAFQHASTIAWSGGTTTELLIFPKGSLYAERTFGFRISTATIEVESSDFTSLPQYNRLLTVLEGNLEIIHEGRYMRRLSRFENDAFHGSWKTSSRGKARDLNVIYSDAFRLDFSHINTGEEPRTISPGSGTTFLFMLQDAVICNVSVQKYDLVELTEAVAVEKGFSCFRIVLTGES